MFVHRGLWQCDEQGKMNAYKALRWQSGWFVEFQQIKGREIMNE